MLATKDLTIEPGGIMMKESLSQTRACIGTALSLRLFGKIVVPLGDDGPDAF
jgi:hypothetical protein